MSWADGTLVMKLLVASAFCLFLLLLLLLVVALFSRKKRYYKRVGLNISPTKSTIEERTISVWDIIKIILLVILIVALAFFAIKFISQSSFLSSPAQNSSEVVIENLTEPKSISENKSIQAIPTGSGLSGYWGYIIAGFILLLILVLILKRKEAEEYY